MSPPSRRQFRAADRIRQKLLDGRDRRVPIVLPGLLWTECQKLARQLRVAEEHGWSAAASRRRRRLHDALTRLGNQIEILSRQSKPAEPEPAGLQLASLARELQALETDFDQVTIDLQAGTLSVLTEAIVLEEIELGPFCIRLNWNELGTAGAYRIIAVDPFPAASSSEITHPHVQDEHLCEGDARLPTRRALESGRLCDFFLIVAQVLKTYNAESTYVPLRERSGHLCPDCGARVSDDDLTGCGRCMGELCLDCSVICTRCGDTCCLECVRHCEGCDRLCCAGCLSPCPQCQGDSCDQCLTKQLCPACRERHSNDDEDGPPVTGPLRPRRVLYHPRRKRPHRRRPKLRFSPTSWAKLLHLRDAGPTEVGGFGITPEDDPLYVEDIRLVRQRASLVSVRFLDEAVADFFDEQIDRGLEPAQFARVWIHTHPGESAEPSPTDEETFAQVFGRADWAVMFILSATGEAYARLQFGVGPGGQMRLPVGIDWQRPFLSADHEAWLRGYAACVEVEPLPSAWIIVALGWEYNDEFTFLAGESPQLFPSRAAAEAECRRLCDEFFAAQTPQEFTVHCVRYDCDPATATWSDLRTEGFPAPYYVMELCP